MAGCWLAVPEGSPPHRLLCPKGSAGPAVPPALPSLLQSPGGPQWSHHADHRPWCCFPDSFPCGPWAPLPPAAYRVQELRTCTRWPSETIVVGAVGQKGRIGKCEGVTLPPPAPDRWPCRVSD